MPISLLVRSGAAASPDREPRKLTFDGMQRVVIGRGSSCDLRLPDASVSHRHASIHGKGADFVLTDEGSSNGTFVGGVRLAARTSRILRSGDLVRVGRVWLEVRIDQSLVTRDVANATRDLALALVAEAMARAGDDLTTCIQVVEGPDAGTSLPLADEGRPYLVGRGEHCELPLADADASREHVQVVRRGAAVTVRDLGAKNGVIVGEIRIEPGIDVPWRPTAMVRVARSVLALIEPVVSALAELEGSVDEQLPATHVPPPPPTAPSPSHGDAAVSSGSVPAPVAPIAQVSAPVSIFAPPPPPKPPGWTITDVLVMLAALSILGSSIAGLVWLLRG